MDFFAISSSILAFIVAIGVLVTVHEFGHFWVARKLGVKVLRFSVGFGKPLWMRKAGPDQTEYVIAAIPFGGYVKMLDEREGEVEPEELERSFNRKSVVCHSRGGAGIQLPVCDTGLLPDFHGGCQWRKAADR